MGKGSSGGGTNTVTNNSAPPPEVMAAYQQALGMAQNAANQPLQQYQGNIVAGFTPDETAAMNSVNNLQGVSQPYINQAAGLIQQGTQPLWSGVQQFSPSAVQQYQSPYTQQVLNSQIALEQNQDAQQQAALQGNAISKGAWGGDRAGVAQAVLAGQQALANNSTNAGILNQGYSQGLQEFNTQQQAQLGANEANSYLAQQGAFGLGNLGQEALNTGLTGATAQLQSGQLQQQLAQENLNVPYEQFLQQQAYPFQTAQYYANIAEGIGGNSGGSSSTTSPAPSNTAQNVGLGLGGLGILGSFMGWNRGGGIPGIGFVPHRGQYASGGDVPDISVSYVPTPQNGGLGGRNGIPEPPKPYQPQNQDSQVASNMAALGKLLPILSKIGGSSGAGLGGMNPAAANVWGSGINSGSSFGDIAGSASSAANISDFMGSGASDLGSSGFNFGTMWNRGGLTHYDGGGTVGGMTPFSASSATQNPVQAMSGSSYQNMTPEQLQMLMMRLPPNSPQAKVAQTILQQKRMMPNVGSQAQNGFSMQPPGYDDGGYIPPPPSPLERDVEDDVANEIKSGQGLGSSPPVQSAPETPSTPSDSYQVTKADPWEALATAGFGMAASQNPHWQGAAGEGALAGIKNYNEQKKQSAQENYQRSEIGVRKEEAEARAKQMAAEAERWNTMLKQNQEKIDQGHYTMTPTGLMLDTKTGQVVSPWSTAASQSGNTILGAAAPQAGGEKPIGTFGFTPPAYVNNPLVMKGVMTAETQREKAAENNRQIGRNLLDELDSLDNNYPEYYRDIPGSAGYKSALRKAEAWTGLGGEDQSVANADINKSSNNLAVQAQKYQYVPGGRGSVLALRTIMAGKPGTDQPYDTNINIGNQYRGQIYDAMLYDEYADKYKALSGLPADQNVNKMVDALQRIYPVTTKEGKNIVFHPENVEKIRAAMDDSIANPDKYFKAAGVNPASAMPAPSDVSQRSIGGVYSTPKGNLMWTGTGWVQPGGQ